MKQFLALLGFIGLLILGTGLYLGHKTLGKLEKAHMQALNEKDNTISSLSEEIENLKNENNKLKQAPVVKAEPKDEKNKILEQILSESQKNLLLEDEVKKMNEKLSKMAEQCVIKPQPVAKPKVHRPYKPVVQKPKVIIKEVIKEVEKKSEPTTIVINKVYVSEKAGQAPRLIKEERKVLPKKYYPNDLLK